MLNGVYCKLRLVWWWGLKDTSIYRWNTKSLGVYLTICLFSGLIELGCSLGPMICLVTGFWPDSGSWDGSILYSGLKSDQKVVNYSFDIHAIIIWVGISFQSSHFFEITFTTGQEWLLLSPSDRIHSFMKHCEIPGKYLLDLSIFFYSSICGSFLKS